MKKIIIITVILNIAGIYLSAENFIQPTNKSSVIRGKKIYRAYCMPCHQQDGSGVQYINPPLQKNHFVCGKNTKLIKVLLNGLKDGVEINGDTYSNPMPAFGKVLKDQEIADVLTYIRHSFGNKAVDITMLQVKKERKATKISYPLPLVH